MHCPSCMKMLPKPMEVCPWCGSRTDLANNVFQLPVGTVLGGRYEIGRVIGQGGFGITYVASDLKLELKTAIKEYFPQGLVTRFSSHSSALTVTQEEGVPVFEKQRQRFEAEARILAQFASDPHVVKVSDIFSENNTTYIVMEFVEGMTLEQYAKSRGKLAIDEVLDLLYPIMRSLGAVHARDLIHRDISPDNIMVNTRNGMIKILDFGAARNYDQENNRSLSVILKPGYAPAEQYNSHGKQGPWTDVYALCATMYRLITGKVPDNSFERLGADRVPYPSELGTAGITPEEEAVLMCGMAVRPGERFQSMEELEKAFREAQAGRLPERAAAYLKAGAANSHPAEEKEDPEKGNRTVYVNQVSGGFEAAVPEPVPERKKNRSAGGKKKMNPLVPAAAAAVLVVLLVLLGKSLSTEPSSRTAAAEVSETQEQETNPSVTVEEIIPAPEEDPAQTETKEPAEAETEETEKPSGESATDPAVEKPEGEEKAEEPVSDQQEDETYFQLASAYEKAAQDGVVSAMLAAAGMYENGARSQEDLEKALEYYQMAVDAGNEEAAEGVERVKALLAERAE